MEINKAQNVSNKLEELSNSKEKLRCINDVKEFTVFDITGEDGSENKSSITIDYNYEQKLTTILLDTIRKHFSKNIKYLEEEIKKL